MIIFTACSCGSDSKKHVIPEKDDNNKSTSLTAWEINENAHNSFDFCGDSDGKGNLYCYNCKYRFKLDF